jgi:flagellar protein FlaG
MRINNLSTRGDIQAKPQPAEDSSKVSQQENDQIKTPLNTAKNSKAAKDEMPIPDKLIVEAIEKVNKAIDGPDQRLQFSIHKATHEIMVKVINNDTGEVIREIPSEKVLDMVAKMSDKTGILIDEKR